MEVGKLEKRSYTIEYFRCEGMIKQRITELAYKIRQDIKTELHLLSMLKGAFVFTADLIRILETLNVPVKVDFLKVSRFSYQEDLFLDRSFLEGHDVLIVDNILDTGRTLEMVMLKVAKCFPASIRVCVLLDRVGARLEDFEGVAADYVGFELNDDRWVVGYGMDYEEEHRELPYIGLVTKER